MSELARSCDTGQEMPLSEVYADLLLPTGTPRPHVAIGMVSAVDGAISLEGRSGALGGEADGVAFRALRSACDAILVGAGTVRAEDYGPPSGDEDRVSRRRAKGLADRPTICVVTRSGNLDRDAKLFRDPSYRPVIVTSQAGQVDHLSDRADIVRAGAHGVDLDGALRELSRRGYRRLLCEGGPSLNAQLVAAGLADELFLTLAPTLVGDGQGGILQGEEPSPRSLELLGVVRAGDELLLRYAIGREAPADGRR